MKPIYYVLVAVAAIGVVAASVVTSVRRESPGTAASVPAPAVQPFKINRMGKVETVSVSGTNGPTHGVLFAVDAPDPATFARLMPAIISRCKNQISSSPPDTSFLLITVIGDVSAADFKQLWETNTVRNKDLKSMLAKLDKADVVHGTAEGKTLDSASLK